MSARLERIRWARWSGTRGRGCGAAPSRRAATLHAEAGRGWVTVAASGTDGGQGRTTLDAELGRLGIVGPARRTRHGSLSSRPWLRNDMPAARGSDKKLPPLGCKLASEHVRMGADGSGHPRECPVESYRWPRAPLAWSAVDFHADGLNERGLARPALLRDEITAEGVGSSSRAYRPRNSSTERPAVG